VSPGGGLESALNGCDNAEAFSAALQQLLQQVRSLRGVGPDCELAGVSAPSGVVL
jgi:hypothetical protein